MSQMRVLYRELRAVLSTAMVCAIVFGLVFSGVAQTAGRKSAHHSGGRTGAYSTCVERLAHARGSEHRAAPASDDDQSSSRECPNCCLAAHAAAAVLPERFGVVERPPVENRAFAFPALTSARSPKTFLTQSVNGARAPPADA